MITFSEIIDTIYFIKDKFVLRNTEDTLFFTLGTSEILDFNFKTVTLGLPEALRANLIKISGNPGGDGLAMVMLMKILLLET